MQRMQLKAQLREKTGKGVARKARAQGMVPGVLYSAGEAGRPVTVHGKELSNVVTKAKGTNVILDLNLDGKESFPVLLKDYQADVIDRHFLHVDFLKIDLSKKITLEVPIQIVGKAAGTKEGGVLEVITRSIKVVCLPTAIPESIPVDVSNLNIGDNLHVHDLKVPEGVEIVPGVDATIAAVIVPKAEEEKPALPEGELPQPEVIGEKKVEGEEAPAKEGGKEAKPKEEKKEEKKEKK